MTAYERRPTKGAAVEVLAKGPESTVTHDIAQQDALLDTNLVIPSTPSDATAGAQRADANASPWNRDGAYRYLKMLAASGRTFTSDDLRDSGHVNDDHANRVGGIFMSASRAGLITCVGATPSRTASRHGGLLRLWRGTDVARGAS